MPWKKKCNLIKKTILRIWWESLKTVGLWDASEFTRRRIVVKMENQLGRKLDWLLRAILKRREWILMKCSL